VKKKIYRIRIGSKIAIVWFRMIIKKEEKIVPFEIFPGERFSYAALRNVVHSFLLSNMRGKYLH
jgi:hypothetical protein